MRDIDIAILSVRPSVRLVPVFHGNGLTYCHIVTEVQGSRVTFDIFFLSYALAHYQT